jgi:hypothetical protein
VDRRIAVSIRQQVEDAIFLRDSGRYLGALTILTLAIAGSSRKELPEGTESLSYFEKNGKPKKMGDGEAFILFLNGRLAKELFQISSPIDYGEPVIGVNYKGRNVDIGYCLYKLFRCSLVHESELPTDVKFLPELGNDFAGPKFSNGKVELAISHGGHLVLDYPWIDILLDVVTKARRNADEFGVDLKELVPKEGVEEDDFRDYLVNKFGIPTKSPFYVLKELVASLANNKLDQMSDSEISKAFSDLTKSGVINEGGVNTLAYRGMYDRVSTLSADAISMVREIDQSFELKKS